MSDAAAVTVQGLRKTYGSHVAVKDLDFEVRRGEIFGFLGTNGAGKTTTIEILEGYRPRTAGQVSVLGQDPASPTRAWRGRIGLVLHESELDPLYTVRETVGMFAATFPTPAAWTRRSRRSAWPTSATRGSGPCRAVRSAGSTWRWG